MNFFLYVDPGSGLLVWQLIITAMVSTLFYVKKSRQFLGRLGRRLLGKQ